jgi:hypothetical protein
MYIYIYIYVNGLGFNPFTHTLSPSLSLSLGPDSPDRLLPRPIPTSRAHLRHRPPAIRADDRPTATAGVFHSLAVLPRRRSCLSRARLLLRRAPPAGNPPRRAGTWPAPPPPTTTPTLPARAAPVSAVLPLSLFGRGCRRRPPPRQSPPSSEAADPSGTIACCCCPRFPSISASTEFKPSLFPPPPPAGSSDRRSDVSVSFLVSCRLGFYGYMYSLTKCRVFGRFRPPPATTSGELLRRFRVPA